MNDLNSQRKTGSLFVVSAPSGAGKTSLIQALVNDIASLKVSVSHTTRLPRANEKDDVAYHFVNETEFKDMIKQNLFLEYATVFEHYYGTSRSWVEEQHELGYDILLDIDWQGAQQIKSRFTGAVSIFILPPTYSSLYDRLAGREDDETDIERRMQDAKNEISHCREYDFIIINDEFDQAVTELKSIIQATNLYSCRQAPFYDNFVKGLIA